MNYTADDVLQFIDDDWEIGGEVICECSDDELQFEDSDDDFEEETSQVEGEQDIEQNAGTLMLNR